jgi:hypothetical protein
MRRVSGFALLSLVAALGCKRSSATPQPPAPPPEAEELSAAAEPAEAELLPGATCAFPRKIDKDVIIAAGCVVDVTSNVLVSNGSTLTIERGVRLRFHESSYLEIGHKDSRLIAVGTKEEPIVFTSAAASPKRGDWIGLVFDGAVGEGTAIEHAVIEYAGRASHGGQGALTVFRAFPEGRGAIRNVTFRENATAAIANPHQHATFAAFERNIVRDNERGLRVTAGVLAAIDGNNDLIDRTEVVGGTVTKKGTWPQTKGGYLISEPVYVNGEGEVASLTIARGAVLKFAPKTWLEVGTGGPAELHASGVTFTSASESPSAGDWVGLFFGDKTKRARVNSSIIEYAGGEEHGSDAAVTFVGDKSWQGLDVHFSSVTFRNLQQAHFSSNGEGCNKALDPRNGMVWAGAVNPCR